jgi:hypothetical protein
MALSKLCRLAAAAFFLAALASCSNQPPPDIFPELSWAQLPPYRLNVARIEVIKEYIPSDQPPHVETLAPRTLIDSADRWARDRLRAVGDSGYARFVITDASMVESQLKVQRGLSYAFTNQQDKRYDARVAVRLEIHNARGYKDGEVDAMATSSRSIAQDATPHERREAWYLIVQGAMLDLNSELERNINTYLRQYLAG